MRLADLIGLRSIRAAVQIDQSAIHGEPGTGFEKRISNGKKGPFECGNCEYFKGSHFLLGDGIPVLGGCGQSTMMERSKQPRTDNGRVKVGPKDCCEYVDRKS